MNKKLFKLKTSVMNGTVTMSSSELLILANNKQQIEDLIKQSTKKNKIKNLPFSVFETVEEIDKFEIGILKDNKIQKKVLSTKSIEKIYKISYDWNIIT